MLLTLALAFPQQIHHHPGQINDPLPPRVYQPDVFEPGLDGGFDRYFSRGEFTPDGRLLIAFRRVHDDDYPDNFRTALTASVTNPDFLLTDGNGHLEYFYDADESFVPPSGSPYGQNFAFGKYDEVAPEWAHIHWGYELVPCAQEPLEPCIAACAPGVGYLVTDSALDPKFPVPDTFGSAQMTVTTRPLATGNPFPSDGTGAYDVNGGHMTYELWVVRTHNPGYYGNHECRPTLNGALVKPKDGFFGQTIFTTQNVTVVVKDATDEIVLTDVDQHVLLTFDDDGTETTIRGIEPSITADGRLILYHGKGAALDFSPGDVVVTYLFNPNPCQPDGWTPPRPITQLPDPDELGPFTEEQFKQTYRLFAEPIRMPKSNLSDPLVAGDPFLSGENVTGDYPWVSKDGSFYNAFSVRSTDALDDLTDPTSFSTRIKSGAYACGDLTNWTIKHIDDTALNPTRLGGGWAWPWYKNFNGKFPNSWGAITMSTGVKPGLWEPLLAEDPPLPTMPASQRIPVLPLFLPIIDTYGEVRFEEADGNYMLYMACKESMAVDPDPDPTLKGDAFVIDPTSTPDSSGRDDTALCALNAGAAFPQEVHLNSGAADIHEALKDLRISTGAALLGSTTDEPFHEHVGFKGQGIVVSDEGRIDVTGVDRMGGLTEFTVQMFVKALGTTWVESGNSTPFFEYGLTIGGTNYPVFQINVNTAGALRGHLTYLDGPVLKTLDVKTRSAALALNQALPNNKTGWRHVTVSYRVNEETSKSHLRIYLDGNLEETTTYDGLLPVVDAGFPHYYQVGPGRTDTPASVTLDDMAWVLDEVALSGVRRTNAEIRRDAYVAPLESPFGPWPAGLALPSGLEEDEAKWPTAHPYDADIVTLGDQLFHSNTLSASATDPLVSGNRSCAFCHDASKSFTDSPRKFPLDVDGNPIKVFNTPTLINAAFGGHKTFTGKASSLEDQVVLPLTSGNEMGTQTMDNVVTRVQGDGSLDFQTVFGEPADAGNIAIALAMYMRLQTAGSAPFDTNPGGLLAAEQRGRELFFGKARCFGCHRGSNFSDDAFHNVRTVPTGSVVEGLSETTGRANEEGRLKTPTLRNLADTGPYFHDGSRASLIRVLLHYNDPFAGAGANAKGESDRQLRGLGLTLNEMLDLVAFLNTLSE